MFVKMAHIEIVEECVLKNSNSGLTINLEVVRMVG
jgi:hypothetical protein